MEPFCKLIGSVIEQSRVGCATEIDVSIEFHKLRDCLEVDENDPRNIEVIESKLKELGLFKSFEKFIKYFQETCKHLKYSKHPVISAPSGLTLGGGFEVMVQSNFVATHTNIVVGLVETIVGLIPAGGGCKEMLARWLDTDEAKKDPNYAPLKVFDIIGYGKTATSPVEAEPMKYLKPEDKKIMNRNSLLEVSKEILIENKDFKAPTETKFNLPGKVVKDEMIKKGVNLIFNDNISSIKKISEPLHDLQYQCRSDTPKSPCEPV